MVTEHRPMRNIFTYVQATAPVGAEEGDTWWKTPDSFAYRWDGSSWLPFYLITDPDGWLDNGVAGYSVSGLLSPGVATTVSVDKLFFDTDTITAVTTGLTTGRSAVSGVNSFEAGYAGGGAHATGVPEYASIERLLFSDDSNSVLTSTMSRTRWGANSFDSNSAGYWRDHINPIAQLYFEKLVFSDDTTLTSGATLVSRGDQAACFDSAIKGYAGGGDNGGYGSPYGLIE